MQRGRLAITPISPSFKETPNGWRERPTVIFGTVRYSSDGGVREDFSYLFHVATCATTPWVGMNSAKLSK